MITRPQAESIAASVHCEQWRPVPGYERTYQVSDLGRVRSLARPRTPGGLLSLTIDKYGYPRVGLVQDGHQSTRRVHVLVMLAFVGRPPEGEEVRHKDGDNSNPRLDNLSYGTHAENMRDKRAHGTESNGRKTHCPRGHEYAGTNLLRSGGRRYCRTCRKTR